MALHKVELPGSATLLFDVVELQERLLEALSVPALVASQVDTAWVQNVWQNQDTEWVRKFCLGGKESVLIPLTLLANASPLARESLYVEFRRQRDVPAILEAGGDFREIASLPGFNAKLANEVTRLFKQFYKLLSHKTASEWPGYAFGQQELSNRSYKREFCSTYPTLSVCPYCDQDIGTSKLDHYYAKSLVPLLACNPWNLVPVCSSCNEIGAKEDNPAFYTGPPRSTTEWLHPFNRPASSLTTITISGPPSDPKPTLVSTDLTEIVPLQNHTNMIQTLATRWNGKVVSYADKLSGDIGRRRLKDSGFDIDAFVSECLEDQEAERGRSSNTLIFSAVCRAVLSRRTGYIDEIFDSNPPTFAS